MSVFLTQQLGFTKTESAIVLFCFGFGALIGSNIGGYLTDKIGNFKVMAISLTGTGICFISLILFKSLYPLSAWMILTGIFSSMFSPAAFSAVNLWGNPDNATRGYSLLRMSINLGVAIGPAIGGFLAYKVGYHWLFIVDGVTCFFAVAALFILLRHRNQKAKKKTKKTPDSQSPFRDHILILFLFFNLINMVAFFQILFSVPVYFKEELLLSESFIGLFFTANGLLVFLLEMPLIYKIEKANQYLKPMILGTLLIGLAYAILGTVGHALTAIILYSLLVALGEVINFPLIPSLAMRRAAPENQGKYMGVVSMMFAFAFLIAPISGLPIIEYTGFTNYWLIAAGLSMLSGACLWYMRRHFIQ